MDGSIEATLKGMDSTDELILSLIQEGHIPEDSDLADTFYSLHDDFETSSEEEELPDDRVEMSDSEYRAMIGVMEDALHLDSSVMSKKSVVSQSPFEEQRASENPVIFNPPLAALNLPAKNQTIAVFSQNHSRSVEPQRPLTAVPHTERPLSHFTTNMMEQRISNMRRRCVDALGEELFAQAHAIIKDLSFSDQSQNDVMLRELRELVADNNKRMDLEQLIYLEKEAAAEIS